MTERVCTKLCRVFFCWEKCLQGNGSFLLKLVGVHVRVFHGVKCIILFWLVFFCILVRYMVLRQTYASVQRSFDPSNEMLDKGFGFAFRHISICQPFGSHFGLMRNQKQVSVLLKTSWKVYSSCPMSVTFISHQLSYPEGSEKENHTKGILSSNTAFNL